MDFQEHDSQEVRVEYVDWRLERLYDDLQETGDNLASKIMDRINLARQHLPENAAGESAKRLDEASKKVPKVGDEVADHQEVVELCTPTLGQCEDILHDYLDIRNTNVPETEADFTPPSEYPLWGEFCEDRLEDE